MPRPQEPATPAEREAHTLSDVEDLPPLQPSSKIDPTTAHSARIWNYWLGGKDNYAVDREAGEQYRAAYPEIVNIARQSRAFLGRAVRFLAGERGVRQFLDIGTGLPTVDNTHEVAQRANSSCRIVYVDNDPLVLTHARAMLTSTPEGACQYIDADVSDPQTILAGAVRTLDFTQPIGLMLLGILGHVTDDLAAQATVRQLVGALPSGSYLILNDGTNTSQARVAATDQHNQRGQAVYRLRSPGEITSFFDGLELVEPGVVSTSQWRPEATPWGEPAEIDAWCGVGRKP